MKPVCNRTHLIVIQLETLCAVGSHPPNVPVQIKLLAPPPTLSSVTTEIRRTIPSDRFCRYRVTSPRAMFWRTTGNVVNWLMGCTPTMISDVMEVNVQASARSYHPGGVHIGMLDGSVHFVSESVDEQIWHDAHSRHHRKTAELPF